MCHFLMAIPFNLPSDEETEENYRRMDQLLADLYSILRQILLRPRFHQPPARDSRPSGPQDGAAGGTDPPDGNSDPVDRRIFGLPDLVLSSLPSALPAVSCQNQSPTCSNQTSSCSTAQASEDRLRDLPTTTPRPTVRRRRRRRHSRCCTVSKCHRRSQQEVSRPVSPSPESVQDVTRVSPPPGSWVLVGEELRKIAEDFRSSFKKKEPVKESEEKLKVELKTSCLFSLLVPAPFGGSIWTTVILLVGWRILMRQRLI